METPAELKYAPTHEWLRIDGSTATIGITHHAVEQLGDLAFVDFPEPGTTVERAQAFGEIESTKTVSELFAPVSGEIVEVHTSLVEELHSISESPYEAGWMIKIRMNDPAEVDELLSAADYETLVAQEEH
jgi:glycine cleavage system H protein